MQTLVLQTFDDTNMPLSKILGGRFYSQSNMWWQQCSHHSDKVDIERCNVKKMVNIACSYMNHSSISMILKDKIMEHVKSSNAIAVYLECWT